MPRSQTLGGPSAWRRESLRDLGWMVLVVVGLHAALLQGSAPSWRALKGVSSPYVGAAVPVQIQVRVVRPDRQEPLPSSAPSPAPSPVPSPVQSPALSPALVVSPSPPPPSLAAPTTLQGARDAAVPTYPTRLAGSAELHYRLTRGSRQGEAVLHWALQQDRYDLSLRHLWADQDSTAWVSRGLVDDAGLAPARLVESRKGRDRAALSMDRERAELSFSGPSQRHPLVAGLQDRLSWMVQLPAIVQADPTRFAAGRHVAVWVAGLRGELDLWTFEVQGREALPQLAGVDTLHLRRESLRPYDSRVDVWLDPGRQHLPVRVLFTPVPSGEATDMVLQLP